jgi:hypothetical protein
MVPVIGPHERKVGKRPALTVEAIMLVDERHAVRRSASSFRKDGLPSVTIAGPLVEGKHWHEVIAVC